jgi:hypothetical protein
MAFQNTRYNYKIQEEKNNPKMSWDSIFEKSQKNMRSNGLAWANPSPGDKNRLWGIFKSLFYKALLTAGS